jgi:hypothetical protein
MTNDELANIQQQCALQFHADLLQCGAKRKKRADMLAGFEAGMAALLQALWQGGHLAIEERNGAGEGR